MKFIKKVRDFLFLWAIIAFSAPFISWEMTYWERADDDGET